MAKTEVEPQINIDDPRYYVTGALVKEPGPLRTPKREAFCVMYAAGTNQTEAYLRAYKCKKTYKRIQAGKNGYNLLRLSDIKARIFELRLSNVDSRRQRPVDGHITQDFVYGKLQELVVDAQQDLQLKLARDIVILLGKEIGMFSEDGKKDETKALAIPGSPNNTGGNTFNVQKLNILLDDNQDGPRNGDGAVTVIDAEDVSEPEEAEPSD